MTRDTHVGCHITVQLLTVVMKRGFLTFQKCAKVFPGVRSAPFNEAMSLPGSSTGTKLCIAESILDYV